MGNVKIFRILGILAFFFTTLIALEETPKKLQRESVFGNRKPKTSSEKKVIKIEELIYNCIDNGSDIKNEQVKSAVISDVKKIYPLRGIETPLEVNISQIKKDAESKAEKEFPLTEKELTEKYTKEADEKFKSVPINSTITITYKQGPYVKTITGRYFGLTYYNDGVRIENSVVPIFDLDDVDKSKFDEKLRAIRKSEYVSSKIADYAEQKKTFTEKTIRDKMDSIVKQNETNGFIFIWNKWLTPENVANVLITHIVDNSNQKVLEPIFDAEKKKTEDDNTENDSERKTKGE